MPTVATATFNINQSVIIGTTSKCGSLGRRRCKDPSPSSSHHLRRRPHAGTGFHPDPLPRHFRGTHACLLMIFTVNQDRAEVVIITAAQSARNTVWSNSGQCSFLTPLLRMRKKQAPTPALTMRANRAAPIISWRAPLCKRGSGPEFMRCAQQSPASLVAKCYRASLGLGRHGSPLVRLCAVRSLPRKLPK